MKKTFLIILILCCSFLSTNAQNFSNIQFERNSSNINLTQTAILNYKLPVQYKNWNKIIDSLKIIDREKLKKKIIGKWKLIKVKCTDCVKKKNYQLPEKLIKISKKNIKFYFKNFSKKNLERKEKLIFTEQFAPLNDLTNIVFKDKTIWMIKTDVSNNYLSIYNSGNETKNGRTNFRSGLIIEFYKRVK